MGLGNLYSSRSWATGLTSGAGVSSGLPVQKRGPTAYHLTMRRAAFLLVGALWAEALAAQETGAIIGLVTGGAGGAVAGAEVRLGPGAWRTVTDSAGRFRFTGLPPRAYRVEISAAGRIPVRHPVEVIAGEEAAIRVTLTMAVTRLPDVTASAAPAGGTVRVASGVEAGIVWEGTKNDVVQVAGMAANLAEKTGRQIFAQVPGVFVYDMDGSGNQVNVSTRGLDPHRSWELNVRQDGILLNSDMYGYPASHYSPPMEAVEQIAMTRGTAALQYGSQFGGLLNYSTKRPPAGDRFGFESITTAGSYGLLSNWTAVGGATERLTWYGYFNERKSDGYRVGATTSAAQYFRVEWKASSATRLHAQVGHSTYLYQLPGPLTDAMFESDSRQRTWTRNWYNPDIVVPSVGMVWRGSGGRELRATVSGVFGPRNSVMALGFATSPDLPDSTGSYSPRQVDVDRFRSGTAEVRYLRPWGDAGQQVLSTGVTLSANSMRRQQQGQGTRGQDFDLTVTGEFRRDVTYRTLNAALYAEQLLQVTPSWTLVPGVRVELGRTELSGRLAYEDPADVPQEIEHVLPLFGLRSTYRAAGGVEFYAGFSQAYRPQILKDILPASALEETDPDIQDSHGWTLEGGLRGSLGDRVRYDLTGFLLRVNDRFGTVLKEEPGSAPVLYRTNTGSSRTAGVELSLDAVVLKVGAVTARAHTATSWYDGRYADGTVPRGGANLDIAGNRIESVPTWISRSGVTVQSQRVTVAGLVSVVSESYADALNTVSPSPTGAVGLVPRYTVVDLNASTVVYRWLTIRGGVSNLLDADYFTKRPQFYPGPGVWPSDGRGAQISIELRF